MTRKIERMDDCYNDSLPVPEGVVFKAADALCEKWNLHYPDAVRMATVVLAQQPAVHPAITHCDNCGCDWLDNGLNPIGCPYCKQDDAAAQGGREVCIRLPGVGEGGPYPVVDGVCVLPPSVTRRLVASAVGREMKREAMAQWAATAPPSAPVGVEGLAERIETYHWDVADKPVAAKFAAELRRLAQQPAAVDGAYPTPRNRAEAVALARLALAYLGVIDAHIDAAIARCETIAAQPGGSDNDR